MKKMALLPLCCVILLTACTGVPQTQVQVIKPEIPASLLSCEPAPAYPDQNASQRDVSIWVTRLWYAHADCQSKLHSIKSSIMSN